MMKILSYDVVRFGNTSNLDVCNDPFGDVTLADMVWQQKYARLKGEFQGAQEVKQYLDFQEQAKNTILLLQQENEMLREELQTANNKMNTNNSNRNNNSNDKILYERRLC